MQTRIRNVVFAFAAGVVAGLAIRSVANREPAPGSAPVTVGKNPALQPEPRQLESSLPPIERDAAPASGAAATTASASATNESPARSAATRPARTQPPPIPLAALTDDLDARPAPLNELLEASSLRCDIDAAHGANWSQGKATLHAISYQGGPFSLDSIDLEAQTATMSGGSGVTGSLTGDLQMRTTAGNKGLTFSAFTRFGDLLIVTVYPGLDAAGRYRTVMTTFGDRFDHETAQFFGACDISLARR